MNTNMTQDELIQKLLDGGYAALVVRTGKRKQEIIAIDMGHLKAGHTATLCMNGESIDVWKNWKTNYSSSSASCSSSKGSL